MSKGGFVLLNHVEQAMRNKRAVFAVIGMVAVVSMFRGGHSGRSSGQFQAMVERYCNPPSLQDDYDESLSAEGSYKKSGAKLVGVTVAVRHGDRSAIHLIPGSVLDPVFNCSDFPKWPKNVHVVSEETAKPLPDREQTSATNKHHSCLPGQLTSLGMQQLRNLGSFMKEAYQNDIDVAKPFYARSTDYSRTLLSAAAFLSGYSDGENILRVYEDEDKELMHGVGLRGQSAGSNQLAKDSSGERILQGTCSRAAQLGKVQMAKYAKPGHLASELAALFGPSAAEKGITDLGDAIHASACHQLPLPCGNGGCLTYKAAAEVLNAADRFYCTRFSGSEGGKVASRVSMYPFLHVVSGGLQAAADGESNFQMRFYFGHDTVIAPLLAALDAFDCKWPPYASRVAFELWLTEAKEHHVCHPYPLTPYPHCTGACPLQRPLRDTSGPRLQREERMPPASVCVFD